MRSCRARAFLALATVALAVSGCSANLDGTGTSNIPGPDPQRDIPANALAPMGPVAEAQDDLWNLAYPISIAVFVLVFAGLAFIVVRFRDKGQEQLPKQVHGNTKLEIAWTLVPALILVAIAVPTVQTIFELADEPAEDAVHVTVVAKQYWWQFEYTDDDTGFYTANELHIPAGREVYLTLDGSEPAGPQYGTPPVMHSFWVASLAGKRDWVPGAIREMRIEAYEPGIYPGNCAEFCGLSHANMRFTVIAHEEAEYEEWVANQREPAAEPTDELAVQGQELFVSQTCVACHNITGHPENGESRVGPDLTHFASREAFAGYIFDSPFGESAEDPEASRELLRPWIRHSADLKPGSQMPQFPNISDEDVDALIAYLGTLE